MRQLIIVVFQREQRSAIPSVEIAKHDTLGFWFGGMWDKRGVLAGSLDAPPVILVIERRKLGGRKRMKLCAVIPYHGGECELGPDQEAPDKGACGRKQEKRCEKNNELHDATAHASRIGKN